MYDIKTIALNLDVTVQTIYNHLKKNDKEIKHHIFKRKGTTYIDDEGLIIIKKSMGLIQVPTIQEDVAIENIIEDISIQVSNNIKNELLNDLNALITERENQLQQHFEDKLESLKDEIISKHQEQLEIENNKLMNYISKSREKKNLLSRLFLK